MSFKNNLEGPEAFLHVSWCKEPKICTKEIYCPFLPPHRLSPRQWQAQRNNSASECGINSEWRNQRKTVRRHYKDYTVKLKGSVFHGAEHFLRAVVFWFLMKTPSAGESGAISSPGVVGHSRWNRKHLCSLFVQKLCILYFRHQGSCSEIRKLSDSACCWKAHTYPCISLWYYLGMGENDPSLEIYSAVRSTPLSGFIPLAEKTRIPLSTQFGVNWFSFHQTFFVSSEETQKPDLWGFSKLGPKNLTWQNTLCRDVLKCAEMSP